MISHSAHPAMNFNNCPKTIIIFITVHTMFFCFSCHGSQCVGQPVNLMLLWDASGDRSVYFFNFPTTRLIKCFWHLFKHMILVMLTWARDPCGRSRFCRAIGDVPQSAQSHSSSCLWALHTDSTKHNNVLLSTEHALLASDIFQR